MTIVDPNARDEQSRVADAEGRLLARFPHLPADEVARAVEFAHRELDDAPVRDFVPILVEKRAREMLTGALPVVHVGSDRVVGAQSIGTPPAQIELVARRRDGLRGLLAQTNQQIPDTQEVARDRLRRLQRSRHEELGHGHD